MTMKELFSNLSSIQKDVMKCIGSNWKKYFKTSFCMYCFWL